MFVRAFFRNVEPAFPYTLGIFSTCNDVIRRYVLFLPSFNTSDSPLCQLRLMGPEINFLSQIIESSVLYSLRVKHLFYFMNNKLSSLIWPLFQHAVAKTALPWQCHRLLYLAILTSYSYLSSGHLLLPPDSHC